MLEAKLVQFIGDLDIASGSDDPHMPMIMLCRGAYVVIGRDVVAELGVFVSQFTSRPDRDKWDRDFVVPMVEHLKTVGKDFKLLAPPWTKEEANIAAMKIAAEDHAFAARANRTDWARRIGCSRDLVYELPFVEKCVQQTGKVVSFTDKLEAITGQEDEQLKALIEEQEAVQRDDPSPLDNKVLRQARQGKRL